MRDGDGLIVLKTLRLRNPGRRNPIANLVSGVLNNSDQAAIMDRALQEKYENDPSYVSAMMGPAVSLATDGSPLVGAEDDGPFMRFITWIIDNQDSIIAFITRIIALLGL